MIYTIVILCILLSVLCFVVYKLSKRLLEFDEIFDLFCHDIETNIGFFDKLKSSQLLSNVEEVQEAHKNMQIMNIRLEEYKRKFIEITNKDK